MFSLLVVYLLALNPWFVPEQPDDVLYFFGAISLLDGEGFALGGTLTTDWPPVFSAMLAAAMKVFGTSVWCFGERITPKLRIAIAVIGIGVMVCVLAK